MDDYELLDLFFTIHQGYTATLTLYISLISGALVASYLVADQLDRLTTSVAVAIFTGISVGLINEVFQLTQDFAGIAATIAERALEPGSALAWHGAAKGDSFAHIPMVMLFLQSASLIGVIIFFFRLRSSRTRQPASD